MEERRSVELSALCLELYITTQILGTGLFNYNPSSSEETNQFTATVHMLDMPDISRETYYFFHQEIAKPDNIYLQKRTNKQSVFEIPKVKAINYKLMGGVKLLYKEGKLHLQIIAAEKIPTEPISGDFERIQNELPYLVIRSFKEKGYPLKQLQRLKIGRMLFKLDQLKLQPAEAHVYNGLQPDFNPNVSALQNLTDNICSLCSQFISTDELLSNPCKCKEKSNYLHAPCLKKQILDKTNKANKSSKGRIYMIQHQNCSICKKPYPETFEINGSKYTLPSFVELNLPFILARTVKPADNKLDHNSKMHILFDQNSIATIGRDKSNSIVFEQLTVSRFHAEISLRNNGETGKKQYIVKDLNAKYGTLLYEQGMTVKLTNRDRAFQINKTVFIFRIRTKAKVNPLYL